MKIGNLQLANPVIAAPMAGVSDQAFRTLAREAGCGLVYTEMISDQALLYKNQKTMSLLGTGDEPGPLAVQIFGSNPEYMAQAAILVEERGANMIDINMGCPTPKIVRNGEGAALLKNLTLAAKITEKVVQAVSVPVTIKIRIGWDEKSINAVEMAKCLASSGAAAIAVHGRTREQFYSGTANWDIIRQVQEAVNIPVIANGDIYSGMDAKAAFKQTGCQGVMIGRASLGNPWIFTEVIHFLSVGEILPPPNKEEKIRLAMKHLDLLLKYKGEVGIWEMRKHASWYTKGVRGAAQLRDKLNRATSRTEMESLLNSL